MSGVWDRERWWRPKLLCYMPYTLKCRSERWRGCHSCRDGDQDALVNGDRETVNLAGELAYTDEMPAASRIDRG